MIHFSHVTCDDCGERHYPGNKDECVEILKERIVNDTVDAVARLDAANALLARAKTVLKQIDAAITHDANGYDAHDLIEATLAELEGK
jgi:hypothetical protein